MFIIINQYFINLSLTFSYDFGSFYVNTICLTPNSQFYFCAGVSFKIHTFMNSSFLYLF